MRGVQKLKGKGDDEEIAQKTKSIIGRGQRRKMKSFHIMHQSRVRKKRS